MSVKFHDQQIAGTPELATVVEANNGKPVTSGAVKDAIDDKQNKITANGVLQGDGSGGVTAKPVDTTPTANSNNLITSGGVKSAIEISKIDDTSIYASRKLPTGVETTEVLTELTGASVGWNQFARWVNADDKKGLTITHSNGKITVSGTPTSTGQVNVADTGNVDIPANHVVFMQGFPAGLSNIRLNRYIGVQMYDQGYGAIAKTTQNVTYGNGIRLELFSTTTSYNFSFYPQFFDLTQMFGAAIADYILSLESGTAGAGVAWLKDHGFIDGAYHVYDAGSIQSVAVTSHDTIGFNQWDEEWVNGFNDINGFHSDSRFITPKNPIPILPSTVYFCNTPRLDVQFYDKNMNWITVSTSYGDIVEPSAEFTTPPNAYYMFFNNHHSTANAVYKYDWCINISKTTGTPKNGDYEPYNPHSYPLDSSLQLRGIPKLGTDNVLYYDGDTYRCDGRVVRKYGIVDLGTLNWTYDTAWSASGANAKTFKAILNPAPKQGPSYEVANYLSSKYPTLTADQLFMGTDKALCQNATYARIADSAYTDAAAFKTAMSGIYLVYELASPIVEQANSFTSSQSIDPDGTESFVGGLVPPQAEARFPTGYAAKVADVLMPISAEMRPVDTVPTANSTNLVTSGGVKSAVDAVASVMQGVYSRSLTVNGSGTLNINFSGDEGIFVVFMRYRNSASWATPRAIIVSIYGTTVMMEAMAGNVSSFAAAASASGITLTTGDTTNKSFLVFGTREFGLS